MADLKTLVRTINHCARCGWSHTDLKLEEIINPVRPGPGYYGICPNSNQPILVSIETCEDILPDWVVRVIKQGHELQDEFDKLVKFVNSPNIDQVTRYQKTKLLEQVAVMSSYLDILNDRIENWNK